MRRRLARTVHALADLLEAALGVERSAFRDLDPMLERGERSQPLTGQALACLRLRCSSDRDVALVRGFHQRGLKLLFARRDIGLGSPDSVRRRLPQSAFRRQRTIVNLISLIRCIIGLR